MRYEMKNFVKITKKNRSKVGPKKDDWKRDRKAARKAKLNLRKSVA